MIVIKQININCYKCDVISRKHPRTSKWETSHFLKLIMLSWKCSLRNQGYEHRSRVRYKSPQIRTTQKISVKQGRRHLSTEMKTIPHCPLYFNFKFYVQDLEASLQGLASREIYPQGTLNEFLPIPEPGSSYCWISLIFLFLFFFSNTSKFHFQ